MLSEATDRRRFLGRLAALCASGGLLADISRAQGQDPGVDESVLAAAERLAGVRYTPEERALMIESVREQLGNLKAVRALNLPNQLPPAFRFRADEGLGRVVRGPQEPRSAVASYGKLAKDEGDDLAQLGPAEMGRRLRDGSVTSVQLTKAVLKRLRRVDESLHCVIEFTEDRALEEAARADRELGSGEARSPLHGIPYGAKDILAARGAKTTWGAAPFADQTFDRDADAVRRLSDAGAILVAKTSVGALAWGDVWFGATTRNPWKLGQGSSGSSAGSASAIAARALPFALGTETLGSLVSPSTRCGITAIRPTHGRVSRGGCMALSWTMDKIGPMARSVADCALVLDVLAGAEPGDPDSVDRPLHWPEPKDAKKLRVGVVRAAFDQDRPQKAIDQVVLDELKAAGISTTDVELPDFPVWDLIVILQVEAAAAFEQLTLSDRDDELVRQVAAAWPNVFRSAQLVSAVQYVQAQRARTRLMQLYDELFEDIDVYVCPSFGGNALGATNLTGHPTVVLPNGFSEDGTPTSICFTGGLFREGDAATLAHLYQSRSNWHTRLPKI